MMYLTPRGYDLPTLKTETSTPANISATVESAMKALPPAIAQACPGLIKILETLQPKLIQVLLAHLKAMRDLTDKINQKIAAIDDFKHKKVIIDGNELPYQPNSIQRQQLLTIPTILKSNDEAAVLVEEARQLQLELNAKLAVKAQKLAELGL